MKGRPIAILPSPNGANGRDTRGRFATGNAGGPGNPHVRKTARLRAAMLKAVSAKDLREILAALIEKAKSGDVTAAREVLDRTLGKPAGFVELELLPRADANGLRLVFNTAAEVLADGNDDNIIDTTATAADDPPRLNTGDTSGPPGAVHGPDGGNAMPVPNRVEGGR